MFQQLSQLFKGPSCWGERNVAVWRDARIHHCVSYNLLSVGFMCANLLGAHVFQSVFVDVCLFLERQLSIVYYKKYFLSICVCHRVAIGHVQRCTDQKNATLLAIQKTWGSNSGSPASEAVVIPLGHKSPLIVSCNCRFSCSRFVFQDLGIMAYMFCRNRSTKNACHWWVLQTYTHRG